jgi:glycine oxidase
MKPRTVIVIGGGVIGLSTAWRLQQRGVAVTLLERNAQTGLEASWAAAGMLSPFGENHTEGPMLDFGVESLGDYDGFLADLHSATGRGPKRNGPGMIRLVFSESDVVDRIRSSGLAAAHNHRSEWLSGDQVRALEPAIAPNCEGGVLSPDEVHLDPRMLCEAIRYAATIAGARILPHAEACGFEFSRGDVAGVRVNGETIAADCYVVSAGAWSGKFGKQLRLAIDLFPRKGQMIRVRPEGGAQPFVYTLYMHSTYLVPRDGSVIVGATQEEVGYDRDLTESAATELLCNASKIVPALAKAAIVDHWMGFRPATSDALPLIGFAPDHPNVYFATAHLRNGILLAPATARLAADEILGCSESPRWSAFRPARFKPAT